MTSIAYAAPNSGEGAYKAVSPDPASEPPRQTRRPYGPVVAAAGVAALLLAGAVAVSAWAAGTAPARLRADSASKLFTAEEAPPPVGSAAWWGKAEWRAREYMKKMKVEDKFAMLHGQNGKWPYHRHGYAGYINTQASMPGFQAAYRNDGSAMPLALNDGPQGYNHYGFYPGTATQFPCLLAVAATFSTETSWQYANAVADEFVAKGANVLLGPDVEVGRVPLTGRSFETISGEDPYLGSVLVRPFVQTIQARGIIVTVKHWLDNNQEIYRQTMDVKVGDRAQHEIYMPVFQAAFEAGAGSVMCSYNKVKGTHACENEELLTKLLRQELGFKGYVVSDWGATHDAELSAKAGLDVEMQGGPHDQFHKLASLVTAGALDQGAIDEKVVHILTSMYAVGQFDGAFQVPQQYVDKNVWDMDKANDAVIGTDVTTDAHRTIALQTIVNSTVLLKNEGSALPLSTAGKKIAFIGKYCDQKNDKSYGQGSVYSGGGSGYVATKDKKVITPYAGFKAAVTDATSITRSDDASAGDGADVAIVCASAHAEEGWDRKNLTLPEASELVAALRAQAGEKKIVVLAIVPGAVTSEWVDEADAALALFMPGEQVGPAVAQLLTGAASPGGRLPVSFPTMDEKRFTNEQYPGICAHPPKYWCEDLVANFSEGVLVGYRWNDAMDRPSAFAFGHGLTYTDFEFKGMEASCTDAGATVSVTVANVGARDGEAVPQLYVGFPSLRPALRQLRGFQKVHVAQGAEAQVTFALSAQDWSFYDEEAQGWVAATAKGEEVTVSVGTSSANLLWHKTLACGAASI